MKTDYTTFALAQQVRLDCNGKLNPENLAFKQPLLELYLKSGSSWLVDVGGDVTPFFVVPTKETDDPKVSDKFKLVSNEDLLHMATPLFKQLAQALRSHGFAITAARAYVGSGGPSHVFRQGVFFKRLTELENLPEVLQETSWMDS